MEVATVEIHSVKRRRNRISTRRVIFCYNTGHFESVAREVNLTKIFRESEDKGANECEV